MKYFCLSHSSRPMDFNGVDLNYLTRRYASPDRLKNLPPFESLPDEYCSVYLGNLSIWEIVDDFMQCPRLIAFIRKDYKIQHAAIHKDKLILCGTAFIELYDMKQVIEQQESAERERVISHPWFSGGHTVFVNTSEELVVTCSGSDTVLFFDFDGNLRHYYRMPEEIYGKNYDLKLTDDVRAHYIKNDYQLTHINCASECRGGYLVSALIQGLIGFFDSKGSYIEIIRGFVGCHGVRPRPVDESFYFSDSAEGTLIEMDFNGKIKRRFAINSKWLHDSLYIKENHYILVPSDLNTIEFWNIESGEKIWEVNCSTLGTTTQFLSDISNQLSSDCVTTEVSINVNLPENLKETEVKSMEFTESFILKKENEQPQKFHIKIPNLIKLLSEKLLFRK